jgi:hypothetical protein
MSADVCKVVERLWLSLRHRSGKGGGDDLTTCFFLHEETII